MNDNDSSVISIRTVWEQELPNGIDYCDNCRETIYSVMFSFNVYCNGVKLERGEDDLHMCQSCYSLTLK